MNVLFAPAQYKETIAAADAAMIMAEAGRDAGWNCREQAISDGGEGFLEAFISKGALIRNVKVSDALGRSINADYVLYDDAAVIEMARASGLELIAEKERNVLESTTFGTGELIRYALQQNVKSVIVSLGGSATNDGGIGMLRALGVQFRDGSGTLINSISGACDIVSIDLNKLSYLLDDKTIIGATDVQNTLLGEFGATHVFGPQKGVDSSMLHMLEEQMSCFAKATTGVTGKDLTEVPGTGAAGGVGFALCSYLNARLTSGFDIISELLDLDSLVDWADLVVTGEGRMDEQTGYGKAPARICELARQRNKPAAAIVGSYESDSGNRNGFSMVYSMAELAGSAQAAMQEPVYWLKKAMSHLILDFSIIGDR